MAYTSQFKPQPIGSVTVATPGTPVQLITNLVSLGYCAATDIVAANKIFLQRLSSNTGKVYIGQQTMNKTTLAGVIFVLDPTTVQATQLTTNVNLNIYEFNKWYIDADNAGDGVFGAIDTD